MISLNIEFDLPKPWNGKRIKIQEIGEVCYIVGPNGSGKSRFSAALKPHLPKCRHLSTDRLSGLEGSQGLSNLFGDNLSGGFNKDWFMQIKAAGKNGNGIDAIIALEERLDLRIQIEATLSHLFNRKISFEWNSGKLIPMAENTLSQDVYRLDRDECHGIKELLVLLTNLYNNDYDYLIIDEPELNLHPQLQAFFMQEVRKVAGNPSIHGKKCVILITHSPYILDFKSVEDVKSVISLDLKFNTPIQAQQMNSELERKIASLVPRINTHHKQLFFSDNPIFVEGILDSQIVTAIQNARGVSIAGAGSCIIDAGGCEEVNKYLELCKLLNKSAHFLYDLDTLFSGNLRSCIKEDYTLQSFLAEAGLSADFTKYCGELDRLIGAFIPKIIAASTDDENIKKLQVYIATLGPKENWKNEHLAKARTAIMTAISRIRDSMKVILSDAQVTEAEGRINKIVEALKTSNILLLRGGTIERYLPSYTGDFYLLQDSAKKKSVDDEVIFLQNSILMSSLESRYGDLYRAVASLPSKIEVDIEPVLRTYLSRYIHELQAYIVSSDKINISSINSHLNAKLQSSCQIFSTTSFTRTSRQSFTAEVSIGNILNFKERVVMVTEATNAGIGSYVITDKPVSVPSNLP